MSGTNQAANLTGMLNQIGSKLGEERDISHFTRNIEDTFRPNYDTSTAQGMLSEGAYQAKMGRAPEAQAMASLAQQQQLKMSAEMEQAQLGVNESFASGVGNAAAKIRQAETNGDMGLLNEGIDAVTALGPAQNADQKRALDSMIDIDKSRDTVNKAVKGRDLNVMQQITNGLEQEMNKPEDEQDAQKIAGWRKSLDQWRAQAPQETVAEFDKMRADTLDLEEKQRAAAEAGALDKGSKQAVSLYMGGTPMDEIKDTLLNSGLDAKAMEPTFNMLNSLDENIQKMQERGATREAVKTAETDVLKMVDSMVDMKPENRERFRKSIQTAMSVADILPNEALKRAEYFMKQITQFNMGVEQGRLREWAAAEGQYRSLVNQQKMRPMNEEEKLSAIMLVRENGGELGETLTYGELQSIAASQRLNEMGATKYAKYKYKDGKMVWKDGRPVENPAMTDINEKNRVIFDERGSGLSPYISNPLRTMPQADTVTSEFNSIWSGS